MMKSTNVLLRISAAVIIMVASAQYVTAQQDKSKRASPPAQATETVGSAKIVIDYSQPAVKDRKIWDGLVPYGKVWRTGANEASWIEVSEDVMVGGKKLPKGKYGLFTIPGEDEWTIVFNSVWEQWGAYDYDESKDVLRITAKPTKSDDFMERFTIDITKKGVVSMAWANQKVDFKVK